MIQLDQNAVLKVTSPPQGVSPVVTPSLSGAGPFEFILAAVSVQANPTIPDYTTIGLNGLINSPWTLTPQYPPPNQLGFPNWVGAATMTSGGGVAASAAFGVSTNDTCVYSSLIGNFFSTANPIRVVNQTNYSNPSNTGSDIIAIPAVSAGNLIVIAVAAALGEVDLVTLKCGAQDCTEITQTNTSGTGVALWYVQPAGGETTVTFLSPSSPMMWIFELSDGAGPCQLSVFPASLSFTATAGASNPATQNVAVSNIGGGGSVPFTFAASQPWITPNTGSGFTPNTIGFGVNIAGLTAGVYSGIITFNSSCGSPPVTVGVSITITGPVPSCAVTDLSGNVLSTLIADLGLSITPATALYTNIIPKFRVNSYETSNEGRKAIVMDFDSGAGLYARDFGTIFSWPVANRTELYVWQPTTIEQPEGIYGRAGDWDDGGTGGNKLIQGVMVEANSFNVAKTFFLQDSDTLALHPLNECPAVFNGQSEKAFSCQPFFAHSARVISNDGVEWAVFRASLVSQPWPEGTLNWQTEMTTLGLVGWGHAREMNIPHVSTSDLTLVLTFDSWPTITLTIPNSGGVQNKTKVTLPPNKFKLMGLRIFSTRPFNLFSADMELKIGQWGRTDSYEVLKPFGGPSRAGASV